MHNSLTSWWAWTRLVALGALGSGLGVGQAQTILDRVPSHDTYVNSEYPDANYGADTSLFVHSGLHMGGNVKRTFLRFDLTGIALETITAASLRCGYGQGGLGGTTIDLHHVVDDTWTETSLTWANMPSYQTPRLAVTTIELGKTEAVWSIPISVFSADQDGRLSLLLKLADEDISDTATFFSKEATGSLAQPPTLILTLSPPTAARLGYFHAVQLSETEVRLTWRTLVENGVLGFLIERQGPDGDWVAVEPGLIPASGQSQPKAYTLIDRATLSAGLAGYRLLEVDLRGAAAVVAETRVLVAPELRIDRFNSGWALSVSGTPGTALWIEEAPSIVGPWERSARLVMDSQGAGLVPLEPPPDVAARFFRLVSE